MEPDGNENMYLKGFILVLTLLLVFLFAFVIVALNSRTRYLEKKICQLKCAKGDKGDKGDPGCRGNPGQNGTALDWVQFYAAEDASDFENDNPNPIIPGAAVSFPNIGPTKGSGNIVIDPTVTPVGTARTLKKPGTYLVSYSMNIAEIGQIVVGLDDGAGIVEQQSSYFGQINEGGGLISETVVVTTVLPNVNLFLLNPNNQDSDITLVPGAGSTGNASSNAILTIVQIA